MDYGFILVKSEDKEPEVTKGCPGAVFLRGESLDWKVSQNLHVLYMPFVLDTTECGDLSDLDQVNSGDAINIVQQNGDEISIDFGLLRSALLAIKKYPGLREKQVFGIQSVSIKMERKELAVFGHVVERV